MPQINFKGLGEARHVPLLADGFNRNKHNMIMRLMDEFEVTSSDYTIIRDLCHGKRDNFMGFSIRELICVHTLHPEGSLYKACIIERRKKYLANRTDEEMINTWTESAGKRLAQSTADRDLKALNFDIGKIKKWKGKYTFSRTTPDGSEVTYTSQKPKAVSKIKIQNGAADAYWSPDKKPWWRFW